MNENLTTLKKWAIIEGESKGKAKETEQEMSRTKQGRAANHSGYLIKRKSGVYEARIKFQGKQYSRNTHCRSLKEANVALKDFVRSFQEQSEEAVINNLIAKAKNVNLRKEREERKTKVVMLSEAMGLYWADLENCKAVESTRKLNNGRFNTFLKFMHEKHPAVKTLGEVTNAMLKEYFSTHDTISGVEHNLRLVFFKRVWRILADKANIKDPVATFKDINKLKGVKCGQLKEIFTDEELVKIIDYARAHYGYEYADAVVISVNTGLRCIDTLHLKVADIDFANGLIHSQPEKTKRFNNKPLQIPFIGNIEKTLARLCEGKGADDYLLPRLSTFDTHKFGSKFKMILKGCGIQSCVWIDGKRKQIKSFHNLRNTFITRALSANVPSPIVAKIVGHSTVEETMLYLKANADIMKKAFSKMPEITAETEKETETAKPKDENEVALEMLKAACKAGESLTDCVRRLTARQNCNAAQDERIASNVPLLEYKKAS